MLQLLTLGSPCLVLGQHTLFQNIILHLVVSGSGSGPYLFGPATRITVLTYLTFVSVPGVRARGQNLRLLLHLSHAVQRTPGVGFLEPLFRYAHVSAYAEDIEVAFRVFYASVRSLSRLTKCRESMSDEWSSRLRSEGEPETKQHRD